jgi:hypothetical protein
LLRRRRVLCLRADKRPDFIALNVAAFQAAYSFIVVLCARLTDTGQQAKNRALRNTGQPRRRTNGTALNESRDNRDSLGCAQAIHDGSIIPKRFRMSSAKRRIRPEILGGRLLFLLRPTGTSGLYGRVAPFFVRHRFQTPFSADSAPFTAHFGHDLRNQRGVGGPWRLRNGFKDDAAGILDSVELRLTSALWHTPPQSHGQVPSVKLEAISN